jgi:hypothetical protein
MSVDLRSQELLGVAHYSTFKSSFRDEGSVLTLTTQSTPDSVGMRDGGRASVLVTETVADWGQHSPSP